MQQLRSPLGRTWFTQWEVIEEKEGLMSNIHPNSISFKVPVQNIYDFFFNPRPKRKGSDIRFFLLSSKSSNYSIKLDYT
jgi:hypothetical protein